MWSTSNRSQRLPPDWQKRRLAARIRAHGICQWPTCTQPGTECDHIIPGDNHTQDNLQWLCRPHHQRKTRDESTAARAIAQANKPGRRRPDEPHPGLNNG